MKKEYFSIVFLTFLFFSVIGCKEQTSKELPNILWITSEDNSPFLGCYGDEFATTPNLDKLASEGFLYTHAYANAPVCAPARNTIVTGVYACSGGNQHMRSYYKKSDLVKLYPQILNELGYYCTNSRKTDYNIEKSQTKDVWDELGNDAHYKNRKTGQPFFAIFNSTLSHESSIHKFIPTEELRHSVEDVPIPPYHPETVDMKHDWAQYYDKVEDMDTWVGSIVKELKDRGLYDNTIIFYYGDHGGVLGRSKRFVYESGTHVPFIVRIPEKYKYMFPEEETGSKVSRIISFVDLVPTLLSIVGLPIPDYLQGDAFLGGQKSPDPEYAYMFRGRMDERYDMSRSVRDKKYRYIRNYMPYRIYGQHLNYLWKAPSMPSWEQAYLAGECNEAQSIFWNKKPVEELYDTENDPWEVNNLANDIKYTEILERLRLANKDWVTKIYDTGFIPEADLAMRAGETPYYDYMRSGAVNLQEIIEAAEIATLGDEAHIDKCIAFLKNDDSAIRYWGASGLLILEEKASVAIPQLEEALNDKSPNVVVVAAEALYNLGEQGKGLEALTKVLSHDHEKARCHALNALDCIGTEKEEIKQRVIQLVSGLTKKERNNYDIRAALWLLNKWKVDSKVYEIGS